MTTDEPAELALEVAKAKALSSADIIVFAPSSNETALETATDLLTAPLTTTAVALVNLMSLS